jgi:hypothetical protein
MLLPVGGSAAAAASLPGGPARVLNSLDDDWRFPGG